VSTARQDRTLRRIALTNRKLTSSQLLRQLSDQCLQFGLRVCKVRRNSVMIDAYTRNRLQSARQYFSWTCEMWEKVLFSDKSAFCVFGNQAARI
jgi:hypothetical protein